MLLRHGVAVPCCYSSVSQGGEGVRALHLTAESLTLVFGGCESQSCQWKQYMYIYILTYICVSAGRMVSCSQRSCRACWEKHAKRSAGVWCFKITVCFFFYPCWKITNFSILKKDKIHSCVIMKPSSAFDWDK